MPDDPTLDSALEEARKPTQAEQDILGASSGDFSQPLVINGQVYRNPNELERAKLGVQNNVDQRSQAARDAYYNKRAATLVTNQATGQGVADSRQQFSSAMDQAINSGGRPLTPGQVSISQANSLTGGGVQNEYGRSASFQAALANQVSSTRQGQLPAGEQLVVRSGSATQRADQYLASLQGQPFNPGRLVNPSTNTPYLTKSPSAIDANQNFTPYKGTENTYKGETTNPAQNDTGTNRRNGSSNGLLDTSSPLSGRQSQNSGRVLESAAIETSKELTLGPLGYAGSRIGQSSLLKEIGEDLILNPLKGSYRILSETDATATPFGIIGVPTGKTRAQRIEKAISLGSDTNVQTAGLAIAAVPISEVNVGRKVLATGLAALGVKGFIANPTPKNFVEGLVSATPLGLEVAQSAALSRQSAALTEELQGQVVTPEVKSLLDLGDSRRVDVTGQVVRGVEFQGSSRTVGGVGVVPGSGIIPAGLGADIIRSDPGLRGARFSTEIPVGVRTSELKGVPIFESATANPEEIPDRFLVEGRTKRTTTSGPLSARETGAVSPVFGYRPPITEESFAFEVTPKEVDRLLPAVGAEFLPDATISGKDVNLIKPLTVRRTEIVPAPSGFSSNEAITTRVDFFPFPKEVNVPTPDKQYVYDFTLRQIPQAQGQVASSFRVPGELENLRPFSIEAGDYYAINPETGQFGLVRSTESRRFVTGIKEQPGRPTFSSGQLPEAVGVQKNLPPELLADFLNTPKGKAFLGEQKITGPFIIEKVRVLKTDKNTGNILGEVTAAEAAGGSLTSQGQILLQQTRQAQEQQAIQATAQEQQQASRQEQATQQTSKQQTSPLSQSRYPNIGKAQERQFAEFRQVIVGRKLVERNTQQLIRMGNIALLAPALRQQQAPSPAQGLRQDQRFAQAQAQRFQTIQAFATGQRQDQRQAQAFAQRTDQAVAQDVAQTQATAFASTTDLFDFTKGIGKEKLPEFFPSKLPETKGGTAGFAAQVKRRGKFVTTGVSTDFLGALFAGKKTVENTAAASLRVVDLQTGQPLDLRQNLTLVGNAFTPSKRTPTTLVQKRSRRISTAGERQEITLKGIQASRAKQRRGLFGR